MRLYSVAVWDITLLSRDSWPTIDVDCLFLGRSSQYTLQKKNATGTFTHSFQSTETLKALIKTHRKVLKSSAICKECFTKSSQTH